MMAAKAEAVSMPPETKVEACETLGPDCLISDCGDAYQLVLFQVALGALHIDVFLGC